MKKKIESLRSSVKSALFHVTDLKGDTSLRNCFILLLLAMIMFLAASCHGGNRGDSVKSAIDSNTRKADTAATMFKKEDAVFVDKAADAGKLEIQQSQVALDRATGADVKKFAQEMIKDHKEMADALASIASSLQIIVPDSLSKDAGDQVVKLQSVRADDFDKTYMDLMIKDHEKAVSLFTENSKKEINSSLTHFISTYLPVIQSHLNMAKAIRKNIK